MCLSLNYLHSYYTDEITLDDLASVACLSKFHYLRLFKLVFHSSPNQYVLQLRLEKARALLIYSQLPITHICTLLGFQNITFFSRLFNQRYKCSALSYRMEYITRKLAILVN